MNLRQLRRSKETALKARDIVKNTFDTDRRTSKYVVVAGSKDTPRGWRITTLTKEKGKRARAHAVQVQVPRGYQGKFRACPDVKIDCDCERHTFVWNYALGVHGAALRDRTNGQAPVETNPDEKPGCCIDGEAWIHTEFGSTKIKDVQVGDRVLTLDGLKRVVETSDMGIRDCIIVATASDRLLRCTPDHLIRVATPRGIRDVRADELDESMYVLIGMHSPKSRAFSALPNVSSSSPRGYVRYKHSAGSISSRVPYKALQKALLAFAYQATQSVGTDDLVAIRDLAASFPGMRIRKRLQRAGLVVYQPRTPMLGGKLLQLATLRDALRVTREERARQFYVKFLKIRHSGDTVNRDKVLRMVSSVPVKYVDDLREAISDFLREDLIFERVRVVNPTRPRHVYDIGIEGTPYFFADGFYVHNCKHVLIALRSLIAVNPSFPDKRVTAAGHPRQGRPINLATLRQALNR